VAFEPFDQLCPLGTPFDGTRHDFGPWQQQPEEAAQKHEYDAARR